MAGVNRRWGSLRGIDLDLYLIYGGGSRFDAGVALPHPTPNPCL